MCARNFTFLISALPLLSHKHMIWSTTWQHTLLLTNEYVYMKQVQQLIMSHYQSLYTALIQGLVAFEERILFAACFEDFSPWLDPDASYGPTLDYGQQKYSWLLLWHVCKYLHTVRVLIQLWNLSAELGHLYEIRSI